MNQKIGVSDIRGVVGIMPTPSLPGADRWDATDTVDLDETVRMTRAVVDGGVDVLLINGTFGECATLTWDELRAFTEAVVQTVGGRVPLFAGPTTLNTRDTIARGRELMALGADGLFIGRPMWLPLDERQIVDFYRSVTEALPGTPIVAYENVGAFKGKISSGAYAALAALPEVVAAKHTGFGVMGTVFEKDLRAVDGRMRLLPLAEDWYYSAVLFPEEVTACWSGDVACGPAPVVALRDAILKGDWEAARRVHGDIHHAMETFFPSGNFELFMRYSIQIDRAKFEGAGFIRPGPTRPPYHTVPEEYREGGLEAGRRWAELQARYGNGAGGAAGA